MWALTLTPFAPPCHPYLMGLLSTFFYLGRRRAGEDNSGVCMYLERHDLSDQTTIRVLYRSCALGGLPVDKSTFPHEKKTSSFKTGGTQVQLWPK